MQWRIAIIGIGLDLNVMEIFHVLFSSCLKFHLLKGQDC